MNIPLWVWIVTIAVTSGGDPTNRVTGDPTVDGATVTAQVGDLPAGDYTIGYRVTSADGHVVSGSSTFRVAGGAGSGSGGRHRGPPRRRCDWR